MSQARKDTTGVKLEVNERFVYPVLGFFVVVFFFFIKHNLIRRFLQIIFFFLLVLPCLLKTKAI